MTPFELCATSAHMTPKDAWLYAASWGSLVRNGDPGACMYGFDESFTVHSESHRADCLAWIESECRPEVLAHPEEYEPGEMTKLDAFVAALKAAPVAGGPARGEFADLDAFTQGYIEALFFTEQASGVDSDQWRTFEEAGADDMGGSFPDDLGFSDLAPETLTKIQSDCSRFQLVARPVLTTAYARSDYDAKQAGRDFWFTRNGHGVGYWDRTELRSKAEPLDLWRGASVGDVLSGYAGDREEFGEVWVTFGDDGKVHLS